MIVFISYCFHPENTDYADTQIHMWPTHVVFLHSSFDFVVSINEGLTVLMLQYGDIRSDSVYLGVWSFHAAKDTLWTNVFVNFISVAR